MHIRFKSFLWKVFALSSIIVLGFNLWNNLINASPSQKEKIENKNELTYKKANNSQLGTIWVAITTNIGTRHKLKSELPVSIFKEVMSIEQVIWNSSVAQQELIWKNMVAVQEYKNILRTNIRELIANSYDKRDVLEAFIEQLEFRFKNGSLNANNLLKQKATFEQSMSQANSDIENLKTKITNDFKNYDAQASVENIEKYTQLKEKFYFSRTYIIYINQFLAEYNFLNEYNKRLLDILINNKEAIIKDAFIVIPDTSDVDALRSFDLIFDEKEVKK